MPVPASINDLSTTAGSNSPPGSESPATIDDYLRAHASFIAQLRAVSGLGSVAGQFLAFSAANTAALKAIVGTVSQSGGTPTGSIIEYGTNANGTYIKWADGTQITTSFYAQGGTNVNTATGVLFIGTSASRSYAAAFLAGSTPVLAVRAYSTVTATVISANRPAAINETSYTLQPVSSATQTGITVNYDVIAIGRWF